MNSDNISWLRNSKQLIVEFVALLFLFSSVALPFWNTIIHGASISKVGMLLPMDVVQGPGLDEPWCIRDDLSTSMAHVPNEFFAQQNGNSGIPLWNNLNGAGRPFLAEFQTLQFSLFHNFFPFASQYAYNLGLVFKIFLSAFGAFFLSRSLKISAWASLAAGIAFALCPHCLRFNELVDNYCFYPWLALAFVWFSSAPSLIRAIACGFLTAGCAYNMHPETFACAAGLASFFLIMNPEQCPKLLGLKSRFLWLLLIASISFMAAAPLVLPLLEFIANGASYKFSSHQIEHVQWSDFLADLYLPRTIGSPYSGLLLGLSLPLGIVVCWKRSRFLVIGFLAVFLFTTRPGLLEPLLTLRPFCLLLPEYTLYAALLLMVICAAVGLDELGARNLKPKARILGLACSLVPCTLFLCSNLSFLSGVLPRFLEHYPNSAGLPAYFVPVSIVLAAFWLITGVFPKKALAMPFAIFLCLANCAALVVLVPRELGVQKTFAYAKNQITSTLSSLKGRYVATGYNLFQPNTNLIYGIDDFRSTAPLYPRRYSQFLKLGGAGGKFCTIPETPTQLNHVFDLASVDYVLSDRLVRSNGEKIAERCIAATGLPRKLADGLRLDSANLFTNSSNRELRVSAGFTLHHSAEGHYSAAMVICYPDGKFTGPVRWLNDRIEEVAERVGPHKYVLHFSAVVPEKIVPGTRLVAKIIVRDNWTAAPVISAAEGLALSEFSPAPTSLKSDLHFVRVADLPGGLFLYRNNEALPRTFLVQQPIFVKSESESLEALEKNNLDWRKAAVIEGCDERIGLSNESNRQAPDLNFESCSRILDQDAESVLVYVRTKDPAFLILTDTFYPGWKAELDGKVVSIFPANHMFRAVHVPAGRHFVCFNYKPASFILGWQLLLIAMGAALIASIVAIFQQIKRLRLVQQSPVDSSIASEPVLAEGAR